MRKAIKQLILKWACMHKWDLLMKSKNVDRDRNLISEDIMLYCEKCGKLKKVTM